MEEKLSRVQEEIGLLAGEAERVLHRVQQLAESLDTPLTEAQSLNLEREALTGHVAERLLTADDTPFEDLPAVLRRLAGLRQETLDEEWQRAFPMAVASEAGRHARLLTDAAEDAVHRAASDAVHRAASDADTRPLELRTVLATFYERLAFHCAELKSLEERCRFYLADSQPPRTPARERRENDA